MSDTIHDVAVTLANFKRLGDKASFHYADESCKEWDLAADAKSKALKIYDENPDLEDEFREIAKGFLWSLKNDRPETLECQACKEVSLRWTGKYNDTETDRRWDIYKCQCGNEVQFPYGAKA